MSVRQASHAGTWYTSDKHQLKRQLAGLFHLALLVVGDALVPGARFLVGPHAGYTYLGERLAETFAAWDSLITRRVFILGPSHHVLFRGAAMVLPFAYYDTPLGRLAVDTDTVAELTQLPVFRTMSETVDEDEHSFEMHAPFIYYKHPDVKIVPIMISSMDASLCLALVAALEPYAADPENTFCVLLDFCHWGRLFDYTKYIADRPSGPVEDAPLTSLRSGSPPGMPLYKLIELLDRRGMDIASAGDAASWDRYIEKTGNTICGQKPILVLLRLLHGTGIEWIGYSQSNKAKLLADHSVSYASGYAVA